MNGYTAWLIACLATMSLTAYGFHVFESAWAALILLFLPSYQNEGEVK